MSDIDGLLKEVELMEHANELADRYIIGNDEFSENISTKDLEAMITMVVFPLKIGLSNKDFLKSLVIVLAVAWYMGRASGQDTAVKAGNQLLRELNSQS